MVVFLKMVDIDNNDGIIIAGGSLLLSEEHIKERRKERKWVPFWIWKRYSKGAYYLIINDLSLVDKEDSRKYLQMNTLTAIPILSFYLNKIKIVFLHFFYTAQVETIYQKVLYNSCLLLFLCHGIQKAKEHVLHKCNFIVFYSKK